jgi:hypothetical protein
VPCFHGSNHISVAIKSGNTARGLQNLAKPDCSQLDTVLAAVKAWPGDGGACATVCVTASLDGSFARRHRLGRSGRRNGLRSNKETGKKRLVSLFDLEARFFVPTHYLPMASCRDAVKAGRCAAGAAAVALVRPRLDGGEHEATLASIGAMISQP